MSWTGHVTRIGENRNTHGVLVGKLEVNRPVGRPRSRWEDMKIKLTETGCEGVNWIDLTQDMGKWRVLAKTAMNLRYPYSVGNSFTG